MKIYSPLVSCLLIILLGCVSSELTPNNKDTKTEDVSATADVPNPPADKTATQDLGPKEDVSPSDVPQGDVNPDASVDASSADVVDGSTADEGPPPPPVEATLSTFIGDWDMEPGQEITKCVVKRLDNETDVWVTKIRTVLAAGSHHMIVYRSDDTEEQTEPFNCTPFTDTLAGDTVPLVITQIQEETLALPNGVAFRFGPSQMIRIEAHFLNYYPETITAHGDVYFDTIAQADMEHEADMLFYGTADVNIPANSEHQTPWYFLEVIEGTRVFALTGHTHQTGTNVEIQVADAAGNPLQDVYPLDEIFDWQEAPVLQYDPELTFEEGQGFRYRCSWNNTTDQNIPFGESGTDEMCFLWAYYYPSYGYRICISLGDALAGLNLGSLANLVGDEICCPGSPLCDLVKGYLSASF
jgi:hypothetical protein